MALAALTPASCVNCTFLNDVRVNRHQTAAGEVFSHFNFAPTPVLGPSESCQQQQLLTDAPSVEDGKALGSAGPQRGTQLLGQPPERHCALGWFWRCWCNFLNCLEVWWLVCKWSDANHPQWSQLVFPSITMLHSRTSWRGSVNNLPPESPKMRGSH